MSSNLTRISGIASGMDTESMIKQLMQAKRSRVNAYGQRKTKAEWRQESYLGLNKNMANFILEARKKLGLTSYTYFGQLKSGSIDKVDWAKKAKVQNEEYFTAKATATATGEYDVQVKQLAQNATLAGNATTVKASDKVGQDQTLSLNVNGQTKTVQLKANDTISTAIKKIREATGLNASFGKVGKVGANETSMLFMSSKKTGANETIQSSDQTTLDFFSRLGVDTTALNSANGIKGKNSIVNVNGSDIENDSNDVDINGVKLSLKKVSTTAQKVSVETDVDGIFAKIKEFVEGYNKVVDELQNKLKEKTYRDYKPLTKEQKEAMKENEIKLWEEKSKSGLLANDSTIKSMLSKMRAGMYEKVEGAGSMYELGITTGTYKNGAKLEINEEKLKNAIAKDPQKVLDTLFKAPEDINNYKINSKDSAADIAAKKAGAQAQRANTGVFVRMMGDMADGMEAIVKQAGAGKDSSLLKDVRGNMLADVVTGRGMIDEDILRIDRKIDDENRRLNSYESSLWRKFSAMEKAIREMQGQSGWLSQQFGGK
ncbi:MAG: flagellar filament capping protein FliD [Peptoanaerobacter stomatis]|uniref:Flagellar hook-associated protein 2 n=1 Tax=Peptoanaerobacter stomatis TaxID=796937 RepID=G9WZZ8_9FIRM|nr:flagellar filament capping protein FliD [Peptoanaerobacter stomatis]EHL15630.1 hypothetical protein HMPREF9629_01754 [Peptoanaerobacter stomatis]